MLQIVWFKRDLRVQDHAPLAEAAARGPVIPLYIVEPGCWCQPDAAGRQLDFLSESLAGLRADLAALGQPLVIRTGAAVEVLRQLHETHGVTALWSHQETGNGWSYARDRAVRAWCRAAGLAWHETPPFGVVRGLLDRGGWARRWDRTMAKPVCKVPTALVPIAGLAPGELPDRRDLGLPADPCPGRFAGGRAAGLAELDSFLRSRAEPYQKAMSSPSTAFEACSRLSAHLAHGTLSMREVHQAARARQAELLAAPAAARGTWPAAIRSFLARLHWHCHFMQKLEDEPEIEFRNFHPAFDGLQVADPERLERWASGMTGWPFVDACMRALDHHGWINFRIRAMLVSVASHHLWLPWRDSGLVLARRFTDYEPGIHWPQMQMQSATTGINQPRIYNPIKQGHDLDPGGHLIRRFVPELEAVPAPFVHAPWTWTDAGRQLAGRYPRPMVEERAARRLAQERILAVRRQPGYREIADAIQARHGSRKSGIALRGSRTSGRQRRPADPSQLTLFAER